MANSKHYLKDKDLETVPDVFCGSCQRETKHSILNSILEVGSDGDNNYSFDWRNTFQIVQCKGCEEVSFRKIHTNSEEFDHEYTGNGSEFETIYNEKIDLYPDRNSFRNPVEHFYLIPANTQTIYLETLRALGSSQPVLCGVGIRAIVETVCNDQETTGPLFNKIDQLVAKGVLTKDGAGILHKLRILGNDAAHEVKPHRIEKLKLAMTIVDHLLAGVYVLPALAKQQYD